MVTECIANDLKFQPLASREVVAQFNGGTITSDAGGLLLREVEELTGILARFAECFDDFRNPEYIDFTVKELIKQRVFALSLGYEDLNDHDSLRKDPLLATLVGRADPTGQDRLLPRDRGCPLAGKSTLNRLELTPSGANAKSRYKKIAARQYKIDKFFIDTFIQLQQLNSEPPEEIILDFDATDARLHGHQLGRFFHGYYGDYCYLPLYVFCGDHLLCAKLRPSSIDAAAGSLKVLQKIVAQIRAKWPNVKILVRGDSGFCRENMMAWCETNTVGYLFGLPKNKRLLQTIGKEMVEAKTMFEQTGEASRVFGETTYRTLDSWSCARRVVGKAEHLAKGANPRFVVTSLKKEDVNAKTLYEDKYCARGDMENCIKEQKLFHFADRLSCQTMRANQVRLSLSAVSYVLMNAVREHGLKNTPLANAQSNTIREKVMKIGAQVTVSVRRVVFALSESFPLREVFWQALANIQTAFAPIVALIEPATAREIPTVALE